jgi:hypothetical protein
MADLMEGRVRAGCATANQLLQLWRIHSDQRAAQAIAQRAPRVFVYPECAWKLLSTADLL